MPIRIEEFLSQVLRGSIFEFQPVGKQGFDLDHVCLFGVSPFVGVVLFTVCCSFFVKVIRVIRSAKNHRLELSSVCAIVASRTVPSLCYPNV